MLKYIVSYMTPGYTILLNLIPCHHHGQVFLQARGDNKGPLQTHPALPSAAIISNSIPAPPAAPKWVTGFLQMPCLQKLRLAENLFKHLEAQKAVLQVDIRAKARTGLLLTLPRLAPAVGTHSPLPPSRVHICSLHPCRRAGINYRAGKGRAAPGLARGTSSGGRRACGTALEAQMCHWLMGKRQGNHLKAMV